MICSYYGNYRTKTFAQQFSYDDETFSIDKFKNDFKASMFSKNPINPQEDILEDDTINLIGYLLYSKYGNSHTANSDPNQFKMKVFSIMFQYGPQWEKKLHLQAELRDLDETDIKTGTMTVSNHAFADATAPTQGTGSDYISDYINDQNITKYTLNPIDSKNRLWDALSSEGTEMFINKFKNLFIKIAVPDYPLWYESDLEEGGSND